MVDSITMKDLNLLNNSAMIEHKGVIIDSGASVSAFPKNEFIQINQTIHNVCIDEFGCRSFNEKCYIYSHRKSYLSFGSYLNSIYPTIKIIINGSEFNL